MRKNKLFRIPVMSIQARLLDLSYHPKFVDLKTWIIEKVKKERHNWGIEGKGYIIDTDLEYQWYPIFVFDNRWLANAFVEHLCYVLNTKTEKEK